MNPIRSNSIAAGGCWALNCRRFLQVAGITALIMVPGLSTGCGFFPPAGLGTSCPVPALDISSERILLPNPLATFDLAYAGFGKYTTLGTDDFPIGGGIETHGAEVANGGLRLFATHGAQGTAWAGWVISLIGLSSDRGTSLDLADPLPKEILEPYRMRVTQVRVRARGQGPLRLEIKRGDETFILQSTQVVNASDFVDVAFDLPPSLYGAKLLIIVTESTNSADADVTIDQIDLICSVPKTLADEPLRYALLTSYVQLLRCFNRSTGFTADHLHFAPGDYDSTPGTGLQILGSAIAYQLGFISQDDAKAIATLSAKALLSLALEPTTRLLPHFVKGGARHPDSEWSTLDTVIAALSAIKGLSMLGLNDLAAAIHERIVARVNYAALTDASGTISLGVSGQGAILPDRLLWGDSESGLVEVARAAQNPALPPLAVDRNADFYGGIGFLAEIGALLFAEYGAFGAPLDRWGIDWNQRRRELMAAQMQFQQGLPIFGLTEMEIVQEDGTTALLAGGAGSSSPQVAARVTLDGFGAAPWVAPVYGSMVSSLDPGAAAERIHLMRDQLGVWPPLTGPVESVQFAPDGQMVRYHPVVISLRAGLNTAGLFHGLQAAHCGGTNTDPVYQAQDAAGRLRTALDTLFPG